jgi:nucleotide-binding universal stress UspA family protein
MFTNIVLPTDGSDVATRAVDAGIELARRLGAKVTIVTVVKSAQHDDAHDAAQTLAAAAAKAEAAGVSATKLTRTGDEPADEILAAAAEVGGDLIAMASHGRRGIAAVILGSQTEHVMKQSKIPVLVYR